MSLPVRFAFILFFVLFAGPAPAQFPGLGPQLDVEPSAATAGGTVSVAGSRLSDGDYRVELVSGRDRLLLAAVDGGQGEFQRLATIPALAPGNYVVELRVGATLTDSGSLRVLPPLAVSSSTTAPRAGAPVKFSVSGLADGTLSLVYAGKVAFGPVRVTGTAYQGQFVLPLDRPASLPANVVLTARNAVGKLVPRTGSATLAVGTADTRPRLRVASLVPATSTPSARQLLRVTGSVDTNDALAEAGEIQYFWEAADGSVMPMGAVQGQVSANGSFSHEMRTPQLGVMSAGQAVGAGRMFGVGRVRDDNGEWQYEENSGSNMIAGIDADLAVDINFRLTGSDGMPVEGARFTMTGTDLDELYPPNDNNAPIPLDGSLYAGMATQFEGGTQTWLGHGCPATESRQFSDEDGLAEFEFGLNVPGGGINLDGTPLAPRATLAPYTECVNAFGQVRCVTFDPAGVDLVITMQAAHTGYGWRSGGGSSTEIPVTVTARVDRYSGSISADICVPNAGCEHRTWQRSANITLVLPKLQGSSLALGDGLFGQAAPEYAIQVDSAPGGTRTEFKSLVDLGPFKNRVTFNPGTPPLRRFTIPYYRGAGSALSSAKLFLPAKNGGNHEIVLTSDGSTYDCDDVDASAQNWSATLSQAVSDGFRFPHDVFKVENGKVNGKVVVRDVRDNAGTRDIVLKFNAPNANMVNLPVATIETFNPHSRRLTLAVSETDADSHSPGRSSYDLEATDNLSRSESAYQLCLSGTECFPSSFVASDNRQYNRTSNEPKGQASYGGGQSEPFPGGGRQWQSLFEKTIPLFRWYWGVPELLSAEVFADLVLRAEYLFASGINLANLEQTKVQTGSRLAVGIFIGVDIDVLFGILIDAGAGITGLFTGELVTTTGLAQAPCAEESLTFRLDFSGWLEIGCPIPNPFDPTCYIPDIEENFNIINETLAQNGSCAPTRKTLDNGFDKLLARLGDPAASAPRVDPHAKAISPVNALQRRQFNRHPAIAADTAGNRMSAYLDQRGRLVAVEGRFVEGASTVLSEAHGIRDIALTYYSTDRALAVWAQSDLTGSTRPAGDLASHQHLFYAVFDGRHWSTARQLTAPGTGEGGVRLARCRPGAFFDRTACDAVKATLVFQRNTQGLIGGDKHIFLRHFTGSGWTTEERVDTTGSMNITPSVAYLNGKPVVAWVRYAPGARLEQFDQRRIALRVMDGRSPEEVQTDLPTRVAQPSIVAISATKLAIAFTRAAATDAFIGTRQALHLGVRDCSGGPCATDDWRVEDEHGRAIYGERPTALATGDGDVSVVMRGLAFGPVPGAADPEDNLFPGDAIGMVSTVGELLELRSNLQSPLTEVLNLSNDAGLHSQPAAALDPVSNEVIALSGYTPAATTLRKSFDPGKYRPQARTKAIDEGLQFASIEKLPDLAIAAVDVTATRLTRGAMIPVRVTVENRGSAWTPDDTHSATVRVAWDASETRLLAPASFAVPAMAPGARLTRTLQLAVPAAFGDDERQSVRATLSMDSDEGELDGDNNTAARAVGGMPVPQALALVSIPGTRVVNLAWTQPSDSRIAGYRVYIEDDDGAVVPIGSSFNRGFADLTARYGSPRTYRVSTYSSRGFESELSEPISGEPAKSLVPEDVFGDSFEDPAG